MAAPASAQQELCPSDNPVVQENNCSGQGSSDWRITNYNGDFGGFATKSSVNLGEDVQLKIGRAAGFSATSVNIQVFRMGYYGNTGGRLIAAASRVNVPVTNTYDGCSATDPITGRKQCSGWGVTHTIAGSALPATGVYTVRISDPVSGSDNQIVFTVRDDSRAPKADALFVLPTASYEAYNDWGGKSLYFDSAGGPITVSGTARAVKVSFDRPMEDPRRNNRFFGPDFYLIQWLEKNGYDVSYSEDVHVSLNPTSLQGHKALVVSGHSEYWSMAQFDGFLAARDAGVNVASFSANTSYWVVRYENNGRTLVCYKTVQGAGAGSDPNGGANDWGPDGVEHTADDALGLDGQAGTADDRPEYATTTFRDNGAPPGDANAPEEGRVGPNKPENMLFGSMFYGAELAAGAFPLDIPAATAQAEFAGDRIWRNTGVSPGASTRIGTNLVGWEWDTVPTQPQYLAKQPAGVKRLSETTLPAGSNVEWLQDEGKAYANTAPPGQCPCTQAVKYTAPSGALVFSSSTNQWAYALAANPDTRIIQATYNILSDMGVQPLTPVGLTIDPPSGPQPPTANFTISPNPVQTAQEVTFDGTTSTDPDGPITKYEWDLDGNGTFELDTGANPVARHTYATIGVLTVRLRVTDAQGVRSTTNRAISIDNTGNGNYPSRVLGTSGLLSYWRMGDPTGSTAVTDSYGNSSGSVAGGPTFGETGALFEDTDTAMSFDGVDDNAWANLNLSTTSKVTVEFWLKWDAFANNDDLAMEFTPNFNSIRGGFLIDPNASQGKFGVSLGDFGSRNNVMFDRPSAGRWHHYAFVFDTNAAAADQIVPYVNGRAVTYTKLASGTGAGNFASSSLHFMSRGTDSLFGSGDLDEVAIYTRALSGQTVADHYAGNPQPPEASFSVSVDPATVGQPVTFDGSSSTSPSGSITKYEWDLDGDGSFETDTGTTATTTRTYTAPGNVDVKLRVTDPNNKKAQTTVTLPVEAPGVGTYSDRVRNTAGLRHYWRMDDAAGSVFTDSRGSANAAISGGPAFGAPGALVNEESTSASFNGTSASAVADLNLSNTSKLTLEFWMKWDAFSDNDDLALEFTPNFNAFQGGFIVDPNAPQDGGKFAVSIGNGSARNASFFQRPSPNEWHHYAFVLDAGALPANQIVPYVDGQPIAYTKPATGDAAGNFANSQLYFMSRAASTLFGAGNLDEVAIYNRALAPATIAGHFSGNPQPPKASFTATPNPVQAAETVNFDASASGDPNGTITKYEWDLDGNGSFETDTGTTPTTAHSYAAAGGYAVKLRVTDNDGTTAQATRTVTVEAPGAGTYATRVLSTAGLLHYWRLGDGGGSTFADSRGNAPATASGGPAFGQPGALPSDSDTAVGFNGTSSTATAELTLSNTNKITLEFWMKWNAFADDDDLAFEYTSNFNQNPGGFIVDPNAPQEGGKFAVSIGNGGARNVSFFNRPTAGDWHHYALIMDASAPGATQIIPYVDGAAVPYTKTSSGEGMGNFANATLHFMSRNASALFGPGTLDEVAIYNRALSASNIQDHFNGTSAGGGSQLAAAFTASPNPVPSGGTVSFNGSGSSNPGGAITKYEWDLDANGSFETDTGTDPTVTRAYATPGTRDVRLRVTGGDGTTATATRTLTVTNRAPTASFTASPDPAATGEIVTFNASASTDPDGTVAKYEWDLDGNGTFETDTGTTPTTTRSFSASGTPSVELRVTDNSGATARTTRTVTIGNQAGVASFTVTPNPIARGDPASFNASGSSDPDGTISKYEWDLDGNGSFETDTGSTATTTRSYNTSGPVVLGLRVTDSSGATSTTTRTLTVQNRAPTAALTATPNPATTRQAVQFNAGGSTDPDGSIATYEWDLDGNGSFETNTGTTATASRTYATVGSVTVQLRVTDNDGGTGTASRAVTILSAYAEAVRATASLRGYWRLGESTGTTVRDESSNNLAGVFNNTPTLGVPGMIFGDPDFAASFTRAQSESVSVPDAAALDPTQITLEAWVRIPTAIPAGQFHTIFGKTNSTGGDFAYALDYRRGAGNQLAFGVSTGSIREYVVSQTLNPGTAYHVAGTYDGTRIRIYVNGVALGAGGVKFGPLRNSAMPLRIGSFGGVDYFNGAIDEAAVYGTALPAATILAHYRAGIAPPP